MASREEERLRVQNAALRQSLRDVLALTRGAHSSSDVETFRRAAALCEAEAASASAFSTAIESGALWKP